MAPRVAVMVDGDNVSPAFANQILQVAQCHGRVDVVRVYCNGVCNSGWHTALGYRLVHSGVGKNATDMLLAIDVIDIAQDGAFGTFVIASSDGDFTHLALRLREKGVRVIGAGEAKAPEQFRAACSDFVQLAIKTPCAVNAPQAKASVSVTATDHHIREIIADGSQKAEGIPITQLSLEMRRRHDFKIGELIEKRWRSYFTNRPSLYDIDTKGPAAKVRFRPAGFAGAA